MGNNHEIEEDDPDDPNRTVPIWAREKNLPEQLRQTANLNPDKIFPPIPPLTSNTMIDMLVDRQVK